MNISYEKSKFTKTKYPRTNKNRSTRNQSKELTAFTVPQGFYEWNVLPFGYKNAPGRYQHFMDNYFKQLSKTII